VGATVVGVTDHRQSPLAQSSDHVLLAKSDMVSLVDTLVAPLSVANALIVALASKREKELAKTFNTLERVWEEYHVYEKREDGK
jgi:DNA-binding MurR/RpiR family transcriptional regulator